jgi:hypothetical protein
MLGNQIFLKLWVRQNGDQTTSFLLDLSKIMVVSLKAVVSQIFKKWSWSS